MTALVAFVCEACGEAVFPARALCPRCGDDRWREQTVEEGVVEQVTEHRGVPIASVRTAVGPVMIARCSEQPGSRVRLGADDGAPVSDV